MKDLYETEVIQFVIPANQELTQFLQKLLYVWFFFSFLFFKVISTPSYTSLGAALPRSGGRLSSAAGKKSAPHPHTHAFSTSSHSEKDLV